MNVFEYAMQMELDGFAGDRVKLPTLHIRDVMLFSVEVGDTVVMVE